MKKIVYTIITFLGFMSVTQALSLSVTSSSDYVTAGSSVTFYVNINGAAAWSLQGSGTGATSGCSLGDDGVGDSGNGSNTNTTLSVTCKATSVGQISFSVSGDITDQNLSTNGVSERKIVTVQAPRQLDTNNNLESLGVDGYKLSPDFNSDTLEYTVEVPSSVNKIKINGSVESSYASLSGTGEFEVNEGANVFEVTATSESGVAKVYKVTVNVKDNNPVNVSVNGQNYTIMKNLKNFEKPELYEESKITINNIEIPCYFNETTNIYLVGIKDDKGKLRLAKYDKDKKTYEIYEEIKSDQMTLFIQKIPEVLEGYIESQVKINNVNYDCLKTSEDSLYAVIYATNIINGESTYYLYDSKENSYIRYNEEQLIPLKEELAKYRDVVLYLVIGGCFLIFLILILILTRPKKKKIIAKLKENENIELKNVPVKEEKKDKKKTKKTKNEEESPLEENEVKIENEEVSSPSKKGKKTHKDVLEQVEEATMIIENYEKNNSAKNEDETMYDIFADDRKKKKRK